MLTDGSADHLSSVRDLAREAGAVCVGTIIALQLANISSWGSELDCALSQARNCERAAARIKAPSIEAMALCLQASIAAIKTDKEGAALAAARAEDVVPGDPEILGHGPGPAFSRRCSVTSAPARCARTRSPHRMPEQVLS